MQPTHASGNGTPTNDALQAISTYLTEHTKLSETEAREEAQTILRGANPALVASVGQLVRPWWTLLLRGVLAIAAGMMFLTRPISALAALVLVFGAWTFVDGIIALGSSFTRGKSWYLAFAGLVGMAVGATAMLRPGIGLMLFYSLVAVWAMARGITDITWGARRHDNDGESSTGLVVTGVLSFLFGLFLLIAPQLGLPVLAVWVGFYAVLFGFAMVVAAFPLRRAQHRLGDAIASSPYRSY